MSKEKELCSKKRKEGKELVKSFALKPIKKRKMLTRTY